MHDHHTLQPCIPHTTSALSCLWAPENQGTHPATNQAALLSIHCSRQLTRCLPAATTPLPALPVCRISSCHSLLLLLLLPPFNTLLPHLLLLHPNLCCLRSGGKPQGSMKQTATSNICTALIYCHTADLCGTTGDLHTKRPYTAATHAIPLHYCTL